LSAEIRNTIYRFAAHQEYTVKLFYLTKKDIAEIEPQHMRLDCFGLLHMNQQIRAEFQGVYYEATRVQIPLYDFQAFIRTFNLNRKESLLWNSKLQIDLPDHDNHWGHDALPLLYFPEKHPKFDISSVRNSFFSEKKAEEHLLEMWRALVRNKSEEFREHLRRRHFSAVMIAPHWNNNFLVIRLVMKKRYAEGKWTHQYERWGLIYEGEWMNVDWAESY
jgi:hypothetical protein